MFEKIDLKYFVISFCIGILFVYINTPKQKLVHKFPSPDNNDLIYHDNNESCYKYHSKEVKCPKESKISEQPIVEEDFNIT